MAVILPYKGVLPRIDGSAFIAPTASVIGDVVVGAESSVWFGCTLRGDVHNIVIGVRSNIQDHTVIHVATGGPGTIMGDDVTVGHAAILHACTVGNRAFVGMQACVMDGAVLEEESMLAAGALLLPGRVVPSRQLWGGSPARFMREMTDKEIEFLPFSAARYVRLAKEYIAAGVGA